MKIILIGAPGAGKGTQAEKLAKHWGIPKLTTGDLFRAAVQNQTALGKKIQGILEKGALVPDAVVLNLMFERMEKPDCAKGFILDGFPRTVGQAKGLEKWLEQKKFALDAVMALDVSEKVASERILGRAAQALPSEQRKDDNVETVRHRLQVYQKETAPLLRFYEERGLLKKVDGSKTIDQVFGTICSLIK